MDIFLRERESIWESGFVRFCLLSSRIAEIKTQLFIDVSQWRRPSAAAVHNQFQHLRQISSAPQHSLDQGVEPSEGMLGRLCIISEKPSASSDLLLQF